MDVELSRATRDTLGQIARHKAAAAPVVQELLGAIESRLFDSDFSAKSLDLDNLEEPAYRTLSLFRAATGFNPHDYISLTRTLIAARLLCETALEHQRIAELVGLKEKNSLRNYCRNFFGCNPGQIRSAAREALAAGRKPVPTLADWDRVSRGESRKGAERAERLHQLARDLGRPRSAGEPQVFLSPAEPVLDFQLGNLLRFPREERLRFLRAGICRGCKKVFEAISRKSRQEGRLSRQRGLELAEVALAVVEGALEQLGPRNVDLLALAWARLGNARRLASELDGAEVAIREAEGWAKSGGAGVRAEVCRFKGSLRLFQRRFAEAMEAYNDAIALGRAAGEESILADALFQRASLYLYRGSPLEALPDLDQAQRLLAPDDLRRQLVLIFNRLDAAVLAQDREQIQALLPAARRLSEETGDRPSSLQIRWIEGMLLREKGDFKTAEALLKTARAGFIQLDDLGMSAIASLELAVLFHEKSESVAEVRRYASDALPALEALLLPEAYGAMALLREAIKKRSVQRGVLDTARRRLLAPGAPSQ